MRSINICNEKNRDAFVGFEIKRQKHVVVNVLSDGSQPISCRVLKSTLATETDNLLSRYQDVQSLANAIVDSDIELDTEQVGMTIKGSKRVYIDSDNKIIYKLHRQEIIYSPDGEEMGRRNVSDTESNIVNPEFPVRVTGKMIPKSRAVRMFAFTRKYQLKHVSGLTYDFLFDMARTLSEAKSVMLIGGDSKGNAPLVLNDGGTPYRGFLEGRVDGDKYCLIMHLTNLELKSII